MKNSKKIQEYFNNNYFNKNNYYKAILSEIRKEEKINQNNIFKRVASIIITLIGTTSIVFAGTKVYNEYIKKQDEIDSKSLFQVEEGIFSNEFASDMVYEEDDDLYYKIITNIEDYNNYKEKVYELPEMFEKDFDYNFLVIIANWGARYPHETDLTISEITIDETTTYITLKQKENPNYDKTSLTLYAIVDRTLLKENTEINIEYENTQNSSFVSLESLSSNYTTEQALKDGCFVEEDYKILSNDKYLLDKIIESSKKGEESFVRIYSKSSNYIRIMDLEFKNGIFIINAKILGEQNIETISFKYLTKKYFSQNNIYEYGYNNIDRASDAGMLLMVYFD